MQGVDERFEPALRAVIEIFMRMLAKFDMQMFAARLSWTVSLPDKLHKQGREKKEEGKQVDDLAAFQETSSHSAYCSAPAQVKHHDISSTFARKRTYK